MTPTIEATSIIEVSALRGWQLAGVEILQGDQLQIEVIEGGWTPWPYRTTYDGEGDTSWICTQMNTVPCPEPMPSEPLGALIGRIGDQMFKVGTQSTITAENNGQLYLRINDADGGLFDNSGSLTVSITIVPQ
jgi:hypothetical protein